MLKKIAATALVSSLIAFAPLMGQAAAEPMHHHVMHHHHVIHHHHYHRVHHHVMHHHM